jgi:hypothetical protein
MRKDDKILFIELKKDIDTAINEYMVEAKISKSDMGFAMGFLTHAMPGKDAFEQLMFMLQIYFFAGVHYAKATKSFTYDYLSPEDMQKHKKEIKEKMDSLLRPKPDRPDYMG